MKIPLQKDLTTLMSFKMFFKNGMREPLESSSRNSSEETNRNKTEETAMRSYIAIFLRYSRTELQTKIWICAIKPATIIFTLATIKALSEVCNFTQFI
jgi:hypothetical protein